jgi:hypothetical protein
LRKDPLFESFEQFYFGKPNEELKTMVESALKQAGLNPTNANYKTMQASFKKQLVDSGVPEYEYLGYQQKGKIAGNDYQDQRQLFGDLAFANKGTKVGEAFRSLRNSLDDARDETFRQAGMDDQVVKLKELRGSYGSAKDLNDKIKSAGDKTAVGYVVSNQDGFANKVLPVPGGPINKAPFGILPPNLVYFLGNFKKSTISITSTLASSKPATSPKLMFTLVPFSNKVALDFPILKMPPAPPPAPGPTLRIIITKINPINKIGSKVLSN